ncbi:MAG: M20 family metallopeptidase [Elusimicrobia bacterium]|nr:M20 family metallopeptidase [Elusimicrobiota bacterium]
MKELRERLLGRVGALEKRILEVSRFVHRHPEEGFKERACSRFLVSKLAAAGFKVVRPLKKLPTAFVAAKGRGGPRLGFIAEYDSLPEIGHGCGHNLIAASGFGAALALAPFVDELGGSVTLFGTPAEENGSAKVDMVRAGLFDGVDAVVMIHPEGHWSVNTAGLALDALEFEFRGRSSHASGTPFEGINALDAMVLFFNGIGALRQQLRGDARVHGIITKGGLAPNVIPDHTEARFYVRSSGRARLDEVTRKVRACARAAALATGCSLGVREFERPVDEIVNNPGLASLFEEHLRSLGVRELAGADEVPGSSDFGTVSRLVPSLYVYAATAPKGSDLHTREFARLSLTPLAHRSLMTAVRALALTGLDLLAQPKLLRSAARQLRRRR